MAQPTRARQDARLDVLKKLDPTAEPKDSACTSDADDSNTLIDTVLAPTAQAEDYVGDWIYIRSQPAAVDSGATVDGAHNATTTTLAVDDGTKFTVDDGVQVTVATVTETMRVTVIATNNLTVVRAIQGSTAVTMAGSETVNIIGPAIGEIARVTDVHFSGTDSYLDVAPAFSCSPVDTQEYERHRKVRPSTINDKLDVTLGLLRQNVILPATLALDGDMETSGVGSWTAYAATGTNPTLTKDTTTVRHGRYSLKIVANGDATNSFAISGDVPLPPSTEVRVAADVYIKRLDTAKLTLYDVTNSTAIETAESDASGWVHLEFVASTPSTCEVVSVWLESPAASDESYWDHVVLWPTYDQGLELPSFLEFVYDVKGLFYYPVGMGLTGSANDNAYRVNEGSPQFYAHYQKERDDTGVVSARFYVEGSRPSHAIWVKGRKPYPVFSGDTEGEKDVDTTQAHRHVVTSMTTASILDDLALDATEAEKPQLAEQLQVKAMMLRNEIAGILASMTPPKKKIITTPFTRS